ALPRSLQSARREGARGAEAQRGARMIIHARQVVTMDGPPIDNGAVAIEGNRIVAVGTVPDLQWVSDGPVHDLGEQVLLPGLINAHCHLDYSMMRYAIAAPKQFTAWVQRI